MVFDIARVLLLMYNVLFQERANPSMDKPKDINFTDIVVDISFHPAKDVIASSTIEGDVYL